MKQHIIQSLVRLRLRPRLTRSCNLGLPHTQLRTSSYAQEQKRNASKIFATAAILAIPSVAYLLYQINSRNPVFPDEIKKLLRQALVSEYRSDFNKSQVLFKQAYQSVKKKLVDLDRSSDLDPIKLSGIGIRWASFLERLGLFEQAIQVYHLVYTDLVTLATRDPIDHLIPLMKVRSIELAQKLATLLSTRLDSSKELKPTERNELESKIEELLSFSVQEILKLNMTYNVQDYKSQPSTTLDKINNETDDHSLIHKWFNSKIFTWLGLEDDQLEIIDLPSWVGRLNQASCFESLGSFYAQRGKIDYALPLYLQTLNILLPIKQDIKNDNKKRREEPEDERGCQAAIVMNNIASLLIKQYENNDPKDFNLLINSNLWLNKSLDLSSKILNNKNNSRDLVIHNQCQNVYDTSKANLITLDNNKKGEATNQHN